MKHAKFRAVALRKWLMAASARLYSLPFVPPDNPASGSGHDTGREPRREPGPGPGPTTQRFVAWTLRHGRLLWALAILVAIPASLRTAQLYRNLRSEIEELLPREAPSVVAVQ